MTIDYPNAHATNPYYRSDLEGLHPADAAVLLLQFRWAIEVQYAALNARRAAAYESELVQLSKGSTVKIPQYLLPLGSKPAGPSV